MAEGDNILATRRDAYNIGNPSMTSVSEPNRLIVYFELGDFNCKTSSTAISYASNLCVRKQDIVIRGNSNLQIVVEYLVDDYFSFETEPAIAFYDSNDADGKPVETFLLPSINSPIQNVNISKDYNYFGIVFNGYGKYANLPYFLSELSNAGLVEITLALYANETTYTMNAGVHLAGLISDGRYIYLLENSNAAYGVISSNEDATKLVLVVTIRTIP